METEPQLEVSSDTLVKPEIELVTPGLQGKWLIYYTKAAPVFWWISYHRTLYINMTDPWSPFWGSFVFGLKSQSTVMVMPRRSVNRGQA